MEESGSLEIKMYKHNFQMCLYLFSIALKTGETSSVGLEINKKLQPLNEFKPTSNIRCIDGLYRWKSCS